MVKKAKKIKRTEIVKQIITEIGISAGKKTLGYFTRHQLLELSSAIKLLKDKVELFKHN